MNMHTALKFKSEADGDADPVTEVKDALAALTGDVNAKLAGLDKISARLDEVEKKAARPSGGPAKTEDETKAAETKAFHTYIRRGAIAPDELKALTVSSDTAGGYLVPENFVAELIKNITQFSPVRAYARVMTVSGADVTMPTRTGTMTAAWVSEVGDRSATAPTYGQLTLTPWEAACHVDVSNQLLEDSAVNIANEISLDGAEEFGRLEGAAFVNGDGSGKPAGLMTNTDIAYVEAPSASSPAVAEIASADSLIDLFYALPTFYRANAVWGMNSNTAGKVRKLKDSMGQYLWQPGLQAGQPDMLLGRPVAELPDMDDVGTNKFPILFGDLNQGYRIIDRVSLSLLRDPYSLATNGQTRFHMRRRVGGGVVKAEAIKFLKTVIS